ncbi:MAG: hypothetical protein CMB76_05570 [Euryarchaeota archaeon]|nr:hypothetical protein [Euryarchaeota archaeon]|tara:strand:+ start:340 stop:546 length:207 start_codon:yes stop_codon:yes gene_type:complete
MTTTMDKKTRDEIIRRCEIFQYLGDSAICSDYDQIPPDELMERYGWVMDKDNDSICRLELKLVPREEN